MKIGIDCRMAGTGEGISRYVQELVKHLAILDKTNQYFLICNDKFLIPNFEFLNNFKIEKVKSKYYSWAEQTTFIWELKKLKLDLVHFPNFNVPIFFRGKFVVTIHDLIHHKFPGRKKSRFFHRLAYRLTIAAALSKARAVIAVSKSTKSEIIRTFQTPASKIRVIYEGLDKFNFLSRPEGQDPHVLKKYEIYKPYILFVGVWRQYKNLERLARAFDIIKDEGKDLQLVLAGKIDPFYPEIKNAVFSSRYRQDIVATGFVPESDLIALYRHAKLFVLPSLIEGFGLIGLEAQATNTPVVASDIPVLREVLGEGGVFFNPLSEADMAKKISIVLSDETVAAVLRKSGFENVSKFEWKNAARQTLDIYQQVLRTTSK